MWLWTWLFLIHFASFVNSQCTCADTGSATSNTSTCPGSNCAYCKTINQGCDYWTSCSWNPSCQSGYSKVSEDDCSNNKEKFKCKNNNCGIRVIQCNVCKPGYFGASCNPCPGTAQGKTCSNVGTCFQGINGNGTCACPTKYQGTTCEACSAGYQNFPTCSGIACTPDGSGVSNGGGGNCGNAISYPNSCAMTCNTGYNLSSGSLTRSCQSNGQLSAKTAVCSPVTCSAMTSAPEGVLAGTCGSQTQYPQVCTQSCASNYRHTSGSLNRICQANGNLNATNLVCTIIQCPGDTTNVPIYGTAGSCANLANMSAVCTQTCNNGFSRINGSLNRLCGDGVWNASSAVCGDNDECATNNGGCGSSYCRNLMGSFICGPQIIANTLTNSVVVAPNAIILSSLSGGDTLSFTLATNGWDVAAVVTSVVFQNTDGFSTTCNGMTVTAINATHCRITCQIDRGVGANLYPVLYTRFGKSTKNCSTLNWPASSSGVCSAKTTAMLLQTCQTGATFETANTTCVAAGARLCTEGELAQDIAKGACDTTAVWTSSDYGCSAGQARVRAAGASGSIIPACVAKTSTAAILCCADTVVNQYILSTGVDTVSYPKPTIVDESLRTAAFPVGSDRVRASLTRGEIVTFDGDHFMMPGDMAGVASALAVFVGPDENRRLSQCFVLPSSNRTTISCTMPAGSLSYYFLVSVGLQTALSTFLYTYPAGPIIKNVTGCAGTVRLDVLNQTQTTECPTSGGIRITISGENFPEDAASATVGGATCGDVILLDDNNTLTCVLPEGVGANQTVVVSDLSYTNVSASVPLVSYGRPIITGISSSDCLQATGLMMLTRCSRSGGTLTISGQNLGAIPPSVFIGGVQCSNVQVLTPHTQISCTFSPGNSFDRGILVLQSGSLSTQKTSFSYTQCSPGEREPPQGTSSYDCQSCAAGTFAAVTGATTCVDCPFGSYSADPRSTECTPCSPGFSQNATGQASCTECLPGLFASLGGLSACTSCEIGRYAEFPQAQSCDECPPGSITSSPKSTACVKCEPGRFAITSFSCEDCPPGTYSNDSYYGCQDCPAGYSQPDKGQTSCDVCASGAYANVAGLPSCFPCDAGRYSGLGATACDSCPVGRHASTEGSSECLICGVGRYANTNGSLSCSFCDPGTFADVDGTMTCKYCPPGTASGRAAVDCDECHSGTFAATSGSQGCESCEAGRFASGNRSETCEPCPLGYFSADLGATECDRCAPGYAVPAAGTPSCLPCIPGRYANESTLNCTVCEPGRFNNASSSTTCEKCPVGTYSGFQGLTACSPCPLGKYAATTGHVVCDDCEPGYYNNVSNAVSCKPCSIYTRAERNGSIECLVCSEGQYAVRPRNGTVTTCVNCPPGATCLGGKVTVKPNYWLTFNHETGMAETYFCRNPGTCLNEGVCDENRLPAEINPLCAKCQPGYGEWSGKCVYCGKNGSPTLVFLFLLGTWCFVLFMHAISQSTRSETKIFMYFVQNVVLYFGPETGWVTWISVFNFNIFDASSPVCVAPLSPLVKLLFGMFVPFICLAQLWATMAIHGSYWVIRHGFKGDRNIDDRWALRKDDTHVKFKKSPYLRTSFAFLLFSYNSITKTVFTFLTCIPITGFSSVVKSAPAIECDASDYTSIAPIIYILLVIVILFPVGLLVSLVYFHHKKVLWNYKKLSRWGIFYENYKPQYYFWEVVVLARRSILVLYTAVIPSRPNLFLAMLVTNLLVLASHMYIQPFNWEDKRHANLFESISLFILTLLTTILSQAAVPLSSSLVALCSLLIYVPASLLIVWSILTRGKSLVEKSSQYIRARTSRLEISRTRSKLGLGVHGSVMGSSVAGSSSPSTPRKAGSGVDSADVISDQVIARYFEGIEPSSPGPKKDVELSDLRS